MKYLKRPVVVEAIQWLGVESEAWDFLGPQESPVQAGRDSGGSAADVWGITQPSGAIWISTREGVMRADRGDWLIKGVKGEFYPCKPDIFQETYEPAP